jgi:hypothetical protein
MIELRDDAFPPDAVLGDLLATAWPAWRGEQFGPILARSLAHVGAFEGQRLVGYVNVATDGGVTPSCSTPAFILNFNGAWWESDWWSGRRTLPANAAQSGCTSTMSRI